MLIHNAFRALRASIAVLLCAAAASAPAQSPAPPPVEAFFHNHAFSGGKLSPNGRHLAVRVAPKGGRTQLVVLDVEKLTAKAVVSPSDADVWLVEWVNNDRLVFNVVDSQTGTGDNYLGPGLYAVSRDGSDYRQLVDRVQTRIRERGENKFLDSLTRFLDTTRDKNSDEIFVGQYQFNNKFEYEATNILRLNTVTGRTSSYMRPGQSVRWVIDANDVPRVSMTYEEGRSAVHYLDPADSKWAKVAEFSPIGPEGFRPFAVGPDGAFYVVAHNGKDKQGLYRYDLGKRALDPEPIVALPDYDFKGELVMDKARVLGLRYVSDARATVWFDANWKAVQAKIDALLPNTINHVEVPLRGELPMVMVRASSDADPGNYMLYNTKTEKLTLLGPVLRDIDPRRMGRRDLVRYKARDGLEIPAWLTLPKDGKGNKLPMVVLVHGGPWVRGGEWAWNSEAQFLASRGYAVLEPEFRGSEGYGYKHFRAGWKQWGLAMQDDLADGARWAIAQGMAEPSRICIAGASYGGYATLMGLVNDPDLFKCGINWVGVSDIDMMYSVVWSDFTSDHRAYGMPRLIGDREKDAEQLRKTSPLQQAARIKQPVLLAYGGADRRVPIVHGTRFRDAVQKTNPNVEWVEYTEEGHGWSLVKNRVDFWTRVEKFLARHIGTP